MNNDVNIGLAEIPSGLRNLIKGYSDYASEVILERAIPSIDGLKPSQRRILYTMYRNKNTNLTKSANVVGEVMKLHPHGDGSIYETLVHLTDETMYQTVPFINGKGNFGRVYFTEGAAASRYTECKLSPQSKLLFGEMNGIDMIPSYDNKFKEPSLLPVAFPSIVINPTQGIAVGMASNIPSFNMVEINNAVIDIIEKGDIDYVIAPDYTVGGEYVKNDKELQSIMDTGRGKIKLRGKWHTDGKSIIVDEIPYYTNIDRIAEVAKKCQAVSDVRDESDFDGMRLVIDCKAKNRVNEVIGYLLKESTLQLTTTANISVIIDNKPRTLGIKELLKEWIKYRKGVLSRKLNIDLDAVQYDIKRYTFLIALLSDKEKTDKYINAVKKSEIDGRNYLKSLGNADNGIIDWIMGLSFKSISNLSSKQKHLNDLYASEKLLKEQIADIDSVIVNQLKQINKEFGTPRRTDISNKDYVFEKETEEKPEAYIVYYSIKNKFIKKKYYAEEGSYSCMSDDSILMIDTLGRVLRVNMEDIPFSNGTEMGTYIPVYLGVEDNFEIVDYNVEEKKIVRYLYKDGYASQFSFGQWIGNRRRIKIIQNGTSTDSSQIIGYVSDKPFMAFYTKNGKFGIASTDFKVKSSTARTKLVGVDIDDEIKFAVGCDAGDLLNLVTNSGTYMGKCKNIKGYDKLDLAYFRELQIKEREERNNY